MHQADRAPAILTAVRFGFDRVRLYVRLDASRRLEDLLAEGHGFSLTFLQPGGVRYAVGQEFGRLTATHGVIVAAGTVLELAIPLDQLSAEPGGRLAFFASVVDAHGREQERHPAHRPIELTVPDTGFRARHWAV
jgi:hypothetical protein